jgi:hypothetical protein
MHDLEVTRGSTGLTDAEPWLDRNKRVPGSAPSFAESPLAQVWARASNTAEAATEQIERIREAHRREVEAKKIRRWLRLKRAAAS